MARLKPPNLFGIVQPVAAHPCFLCCGSAAGGLVFVTEAAQQPAVVQVTSETASSLDALAVPESWPFRASTVTAVPLRWQGIYRSNSPLDENLPFLARLNLRTVLFLSPEVLLRSVVDFFEEQNIKLHNLGLQAWRPEPNWTPICDEFVKEALEMILDRRAHPLLVCCSSGILQTCPLVGCLRRIQHWSLTSILDEFRAFAGSKGRLAHEQFIEFFDIDLVTLPEQEHLPTWFVDRNLEDPGEARTEAARLAALLHALLAKPEEDRTAEETAAVRATRFQLRCLEGQHSTLLCSPEVVITKQSLVDDEDDD